MNPDFQALMQDATRLARSGRLGDATVAIQRLLAGAAVGGLVGSAAVTQAADSATRLNVQPEVLDGCVHEVAEGSQAAPRRPTTTARARHPAEGDFSPGTHSHAQLTRRYKLFVPPARFEGPRPLVVMLHGCTQDPDDFAAGTGMNTLALDEGFYVLYPAQDQNANPSRCWNWFKHSHQQRGRGEPAVIASMTQAVMQTHAVDPKRVFIAGLSAGGAMAAIAGSLHPELFAAVGVHSGLAPDAASSLPEALQAMRGAAADPAPRAGAAGRSARSAAFSLPVIVFHGDQDQTVHPINGRQLIAAAQRMTQTNPARSTHPAQATNPPQVLQGISPQGQRYTRTVFDVPAGKGAAEHWLLHGAGHAWSGGQAAGSFTNPLGPDASREMLRFFMAHPRDYLEKPTDFGSLDKPTRGR